MSELPPPSSSPYPKPMASSLPEPLPPLQAWPSRGTPLPRKPASRKELESSGETTLYRWHATTSLLPATKVRPSPLTSLVVTVTSKEERLAGKEKIVLEVGIQGNHGSWLRLAIEDLFSRVPHELGMEDWGEDCGAFALLEEGWSDLWGRQEWEAAEPLPRLLALLYSASLLAFLPLPPPSQGEAYPHLFSMEALVAALPEEFTTPACYDEAFLPGTLFSFIPSSCASEDVALQRVRNFCALDPSCGGLLECLFTCGLPEVREAWQVIYYFYALAQKEVWVNPVNLRRMTTVSPPQAFSPQGSPPPLPGKFYSTLPWLPGMLPEEETLKELLSPESPQDFFTLGLWPKRTSLRGESTCYDWFLWHKFHPPLSSESIRQVLEGWLEDFFYSDALFTPTALEAWNTCGPLVYLLHRLMPWRKQFTQGEQALLLYRCSPPFLKRLLRREVANLLPHQDVARPVHEDDLVFLGMLTELASPLRAAFVLLSWPNCPPTWEHKPLGRDELFKLARTPVFDDSPQTWWLSFLREGEVQARVQVEQAAQESSPEEE